jgi:hypothetical protein
MTNLSKTSIRKTNELLDLLKGVLTQKDSSPEPLEKFQNQYLKISSEEKLGLFEAIVEKFEIKREDLEGELRRLATLPEKEGHLWQSDLSRLRRKVESPRLRIFRHFLNISGGLKFLLDFRADLIAAQRQTQVDLEPLDEDLSQLLNFWFQSGFLFLREITLESSYRQIRFLKNHDFVHPMASLEEMGDRLGKDRRCFALYHRAMPKEPVVFIEAALTRGIAASIHDIIKKTDDSGGQKKAPDTAIFYSINNTQNGLAGLGLGKILIFRVVEALRKSDPDIKVFATLSPIPGFWERYLRPILKGEDGPFLLKRQKIEEFFPKKVLPALLEAGRGTALEKPRDLSGALLKILSDPHWIENSAVLKLLKDPMTALTYHYLADEKDRRGRLLNPVANFHLTNGAGLILKNVRFAANQSPRGLMESCSMMVNYLYSPTWLQQISRTMQALLPWRT